MKANHTRKSLLTTIAAKYDSIESFSQRMALQGIEELLTAKEISVLDATRMIAANGIAI